MDHQLQVVLDRLQEPHAFESTVDGDFVHLQTNLGNLHQLTRQALAFSQQLLMRHNACEAISPLPWWRKSRDLLYFESTGRA